MSCNISITPCPDYTVENIVPALERALAPVGGLDWVKPGMRIAIKANMVSRMKPEEGATTHPLMVRELARMLIERGAQVVVGDSPGGPFTGAWVYGIYSGCGMRAVEEVGAELNKDFSTMEASIPEGVAVKSFPYTAWLEKADAVIDFCKLKTHGLTGITCAVKNFFGVIPGTRKPEFHYMHPTAEGFCNMLLDLNLYVKPRLTLVDAVLCMEGNGPTQGTPRQMGAIIAADTTYNCDLFCAHLIGLDTENAPTVRLAIQRGLCPDSWEKLDIQGNWEPFYMPDFEKLPPRQDTGLKTNVPIIGKFMERNFSARPQVDKAKCVGCGKCAEVCPMKTIQVKNKKAAISRKNCIRCFCCQEFCPKGAITSQRPVIARMLGK